MSWGPGHWNFSVAYRMLRESWVSEDSTLYIYTRVKISESLTITTQHWRQCIYYYFLLCLNVYPHTLQPNGIRTRGLHSLLPRTHTCLYFDIYSICIYINIWSSWLSRVLSSKRSGFDSRSARPLNSQNLIMHVYTQKYIYWRVNGLVVWFSLWVREVVGSIPTWPQSRLFSILDAAAIW